MTRAMKDSGIEWIGQIPENWNVKLLGKAGKFTASGIDKTINPSQPSVRIINYTDVYGNKSHLLNEQNYMVVTADEAKIHKHQVKEGDLIFTPSSETIEDIGVSCLINEELQNTSFSYHVLRYEFIDTFYKNYKKYLCNNHFVLNWFSSRATGSIRKTLSRVDFKECPIIVPPLYEQQKIADYLDKRCEKIDTAIDNQKQIIEKLKEYKQSLITETVTKGLNPNVKLKDSGIEWIGSIPEHWEMAKFKVILLKKVDNRGRTPELSDNENDIPLIEVNAIGGKYPDTNLIKKYISQESHDKYIRDDLKTGDIIVTTVGATIGKCSVVPQSFNYCIAQNLVAYRVNEKNYPLFWSYYFKSQTFQTMFFQYDKGNTINNVKISNMEQGYIVIPTLKEQKEIAEYLDKKCNRIDEAIKQKEETISKLEEYKKSLIFECVTGKKEVS